MNEIVVLLQRKLKRSVFYFLSVIHSVCLATVLGGCSSSTVMGSRRSQAGKPLEKYEVAIKGNVPIEIIFVGNNRNILGFDTVGQFIAGRVIWHLERQYRPLKFVVYREGTDAKGPRLHLEIEEKNIKSTDSFWKNLSAIMTFGVVSSINTDYEYTLQSKIIAGEAVNCERNDIQFVRYSVSGLDLGDAGLHGEQSVAYMNMATEALKSYVLKEEIKGKDATFTLGCKNE